MKKLREIRKKKGISQLRLSKMVGVSRSCIAKWETGASFPRGNTLARLSVALEVPIYTFFEDIEKSPD